MKGIVLAAGRGMRLLPHTHLLPKCMLPVAGRPLLWSTLDALRGAGCGDIAVVTGHLAGEIRAPDCHTIFNADYGNNNILHSLMYAREYLDDVVLVTYSDIVVDPLVHKQLMSCSGDIVVVVDRDWQLYYEGRTHHPISEAEKAFVDSRSGRVKAMGKHLDPAQAASCLCTEFLGLWKMTAAGAKVFRAHFESLDRRLAPTSAFQDAKEWRKAYVTDFLTDLIDSGVTVNCLIIERGWAEIDTVQDYERLPAIATTQRILLGESQDV